MTWVSTDGESYWTSQWFDPTKTDIVAYTANTPIDGVKGNHDNASGYSTTFPKYFPFPYPAATLKAGTGTGTSTPAAYNNLYWSVDYGPVHISFVDEYSSFAPGSQQYTWLTNDLATTTKPWKFLVSSRAGVLRGLGRRQHFRPNLPRASHHPVQRGPRLRRSQPQLRSHGCL